MDAYSEQEKAEIDALILQAMLENNYSPWTQADLDAARRIALGEEALTENATDSDLK